MNNDVAAVKFNFLSKYIPDNFIGAEIGVFKGHFSSLLLSKNPRKLFLVDPWYRLSAEWGWVRTENPSTFDAFINIMLDFKKEINEGVVIPVPDFSANFLKCAPLGCFDFVYIDSSHSYEDTLQEISLSIPLLKPGGLILGDDWHDDPSHRHFGVAKAVNKYIDSGELKQVFKPQYMQWGLRVS